MDTRPTEEEVRELIRLLSRLEVGILPFEVFLQVARLVALPILEIVPLRLRDGRVEVLLLARPIDDRLWPGQLHTPGSVIRTYDSPPDFSGAIKRVLEDELMGTEVSVLHFVKTFLNQNERGKECASAYWAEVLEEPKVGRFYPTDTLPDNLMTSQVGFIEDAVNDFKMYKKVSG